VRLLVASSSRGLLPCAWPGSARLLHQLARTLVIASAASSPQNTKQPRFMEDDYDQLPCDQQSTNPINLTIL
jgi:hypothetical protein